MFDTARIVGVFQDDAHPKTIAVGITSEDGNSLLIQESDPTVIVEMANRLVMFADELMQRETDGVDRFIAEMQASGARTIGEFAEMRRKRPKLTLVNGEAE